MLAVFWPDLSNESYQWATGGPWKGLFLPFALLQTVSSAIGVSPPWAHLGPSLLVI